MGKINNTKRIVREDFDSEYHSLIDKLAYVLNTFMEQTVRQVNGNLDSTNLSSDIITAKMTVDANGTPIGNNLIKSSVSRPVGVSVLNHTNKTNGNVFPTSHPSISFTAGTGTGVIKIRNISGLQANNEYELTIKVE